MDGAVVTAPTAARLGPTSRPASRAPRPDPRLRRAVSVWASFFRRCINARLEPDSFESFVRIVYRDHPLPAAAIADLFLRPQPNCCYSLDPRVPPYIQVLNDLGYIDAPATLRALYRYSTSHRFIESQKGQQREQGTDAKDGPADARDAPLRWQNSYWVEEVIFFRLCKAVHEGQAVQDTNTAFEVVKIISDWLALFTETSSAFAADLLSQAHNLQVEMESSRAAFVPLLLRLTDNQALLKAISKPAAKDVRTELSQNLANFVPTLQLVNSGTEKSITEKLELFRSRVLASLDPADRKKKQAADAAMNEMLDSAVGPDAFDVPEAPIITTRVGMYIYLNAVLVARPLMDDAVFFNYINNRYRGDNQSAAIDLVLASFDVLANSVFRDGGRQDAQLLRSFLINKVPLLLYQLLPPGFSAPSAEMCITNALSQVDTSLFPTASLMFDESRNNNPYTESVREEFCAACVLHGLINREHVETILGEMSMSYEPEKKSKEKLVQDYQAHNIKVSDLLRDLDKMDGNVGAVCNALAEVIRRLCSERDTMTLKMVCTEMAQRLQSLDVLLLFETLPGILGPICQLLETWRYEEDQTEYQPVYEEFGAILLLVMAFVHRYGLTPSDIGLNMPNSRVRKIITQAHVLRGKEQLSEQEDKHLNGWILGLFDTEAGGLGDDLMSSCPPQDFYLLIAPLFYNIAVGYSNGYINDESLKGGVEYLVETFLLPSLVPAIHFLISFLKINQSEQKAVIRLLQLLLLPTAISSEASAMLNSIKRIVAKPLTYVLQSYINKRDPKNEDVNSLITALKDYVPNSKRTGHASHGEMSEWCRAEPNGLWTSLKNTTQGLMQWAVHPGMSITPITYSHRQFILGARMMGPQRVLRMLLEEVRLQTRNDADAQKQGEQQPSQTVGVVTDVATAIICAPDVTNEPAAPTVETTTQQQQQQQQQPPQQLQRLLTPRDILKIEAERCREIQKKDPGLAEIVVRLYRRVEAQMEQLAQPQPGMMGQPPDMTGMDMGAGTGMDMGAGAGMDLGAGSGMDMDMGAGTGMDMGAGADVSLDALAAMQGDGGVGLDMSLEGLGDPSGTGGDGDGDLFAGLDTDIDASLEGINWGLDLS